MPAPIEDVEHELAGGRAGVEFKFCKRSSTFFTWSLSMMATRSRTDLAMRSSLQTMRMSPRLKCRHQATVHAEHIHHRRRRRRRFDRIRGAWVCVRRLMRILIARGMRAANGRYSFDNPVMRDYNAPDFAK
jgi:hypothetical protein